MKKSKNHTGSLSITLDLKKILIDYIGNILTFLPYELIKAQKENLCDPIISEDDITGVLCRSLNYNFTNILVGVVHFEYRSKDIGARTATDIGIYRVNKHSRLFDVEAKRLPTPLTSDRDEREYVTSNYTNGGIERFKLNLHGQTMNHAFMIGYMQSEDENYWITKVNKWIGHEIKNPTKTTLKWSIDEQIQPILNINNSVYQYSSTHNRTTGPDITLTHFWVDLT